MPLACEAGGYPLFDAQSSAGPSKRVVLNVEQQEDNQLGLTTGSIYAASGDSKMDTILEKLECLRFHRNPLEFVLRFLPAGGRTITGYSYDLYGYNREDTVILSLHFDSSSWSYGGRPLPLYASRQVQEDGQALGELLWEIAENINSKL